MWRERFYRDRRKIVPDGVEELLEPAAVAVRAWLERRSTQGARWSAHASGARLQTGPERDLDPVETVRRPPTNDRGEDTVRSRQ